MKTVDSFSEKPEETFGLDMDFAEALERFAQVRRPDLETDEDAEKGVPDEQKGASEGVSKKR